MTDDLISRAAALNTLTELSCDDNAHWGVIIEAIRALPAIAASQPADPAVKADSCQRVTVKPLVWNGDSIRVTAKGMGKYYACMRMFHGQKGAGWECDEGDWHPTLDAAKGIAQADYEKRILAAIETQPDPRDAVIAQLVEALEKSREGWANAIELGIIHKNHVTSAGILHDEAAAALAAAKGGAA